MLCLLILQDRNGHKVYTSPSSIDNTSQRPLASGLGLPAWDLSIIS